MPTRKYKKISKKTVKYRKRKGGGPNISKQKPPLEPSSKQKPPLEPSPLRTKTVRFPESNDLFSVKEISPNKDEMVTNDDEDESKLKNLWIKKNEKLKKTGNQITFKKYKERYNKKKLKKDKEELDQLEHDIQYFDINQKTKKNTNYNKRAPLTLDEQLKIHMKEEQEKERKNV